MQPSAMEASYVMRVCWCLLLIAHAAQAIASEQPSLVPMVSGEMSAVHLYSTSVSSPNATDGSGSGDQTFVSLEPEESSAPSASLPSPTSSVVVTPTALPTAVPTPVSPSPSQSMGPTGSSQPLTTAISPTPAPQCSGYGIVLADQQSVSRPQTLIAGIVQLWRGELHRDMVSITRPTTNEASVIKVEFDVCSYNVTRLVRVRDEARRIKREVRRNETVVTLTIDQSTNAKVKDILIEGEESATQQPPSVTAMQRPSSVPATQRPSSVPATQQPSSVAATQRPSSVPGTQQPSSVPATQQPSSVTPTQQPSSVPATQLPSSVPGTQQPPSVTATQRPSSVPATQRPSSVPGTQQPSSIPVTQRPSSVLTTSSVPATLTVPVIPTPVADITFVFRFGAQVQVNGTRDVVAESFAVAIAELLDFDRDLICCIAFELDGERFRRADTVTFDAVAFSGRSTASPEDKELVVNAVEDVKRKVESGRETVHLTVGGRTIVIDRVSVPTATPPTGDGDDGDDDLSSGAVTGIIIAILAVALGCLVLAIAIGYFIKERRHSRTYEFEMMSGAKTVKAKEAPSDSSMPTHKGEREIDSPQSDVEEGKSRDTEL